MRGSCSAAALSDAGRSGYTARTTRLATGLFEGVARGRIKTKNKREMDMFFLDRLKPEFSRDASGRTPNEKLVASREAAGRRWAPPLADT